MPHDPRIICLYQTRLRERRAAAWRRAETGSGTALLSCAALAVATIVFFWSYDAIAHRDVPFVPSLARVSTNGYSPISVTETPVPNMDAPEIIRANADVPSTHRNVPSAVHENKGAREPNSL